MQKSRIQPVTYTNIQPVFSLDYVGIPTHLLKQRVDYAGPSDPRMFTINGSVFISFTALFHDVNHRFIESMVGSVFLYEV